MQQNVALEVARKVELSSTFRSVAKQVAAWNMLSAKSWNVFHSPSVAALQVAGKIASGGSNMALISLFENAQGFFARWKPLIFISTSLIESDLDRLL